MTSSIVKRWLTEQDNTHDGSGRLLQRIVHKEEPLTPNVGNYSEASSVNSLI